MTNDSKVAKRFFFAKKKQKTLHRAGAPDRPRTPYRSKVFRFFFAKKKRFLLPPSLRSLDAVIDGTPVTLVRSAEPSPYEQGLIDGQDWGANDVVWLLRRLLRRGGALIDVGANIGLVTLPIAGDGTPVIALEMLPANCLKLQLACLLNGLDRVRVLQAAISCEDAMLDYGGEDAWGKIGAGAQQAAALRLDTALRLPGLRLPSLRLCGLRLPGLRLPGLTLSRRLVIKIDVEGHELEVLQGARHLIATRRPAILFESIERADRPEDANSLQCKRLLEQLGYRLLLQRGRRLLPRRAADLQEGVVADVLAVPAEAPHWLAGLELSELTPQERVDWVAEMAAQQHAGHRRDAVAAIAKLREEGASYVGLTAALASKLLTDPDQSVRGKAKARGFAPGPH